MPKLHVEYLEEYYEIGPWCVINEAGAAIGFYSFQDVAQEATVFYEQIGYYGEDWMTP